MHCVAQVGEVMAALAETAQDAAGPFFTDLMVTILEVLNSGNKVIFGHLDDAMRKVSRRVGTFLKLHPVYQPQLPGMLH